MLFTPTLPVKAEFTEIPGMLRMLGSAKNSDNVEQFWTLLSNFEQC